MLKVGLTGGIGSGKSFIANIFEAMGVPVFYADTQAHKLMETDGTLRKSIQETFGKDLYQTGSLNRQALANIVFADKSKLQELNALVHPAVHRAFRTWTKTQEQYGTPYVIEEAAILFESGAYKNMDKIIAIAAPETLRIKRVMKRDNAEEEQVKARMRNQWTDNQRIKLSDFVIYNQEKELLLPQIVNIDKKLSV
jgi:dephospho-CoA kinase